jgi:hypothetical protein
MQSAIWIVWNIPYEWVEHWDTERSTSWLICWDGVYSFGSRSRRGPREGSWIQSSPRDKFGQFGAGGLVQFGPADLCIAVMWCDRHALPHIYYITATPWCALLIFIRPPPISIIITVVMRFLFRLSFTPRDYSPPPPHLCVEMAYT